MHRIQSEALAASLQRHVPFEHPGAPTVTTAAQHDEKAPSGWWILPFALFGAGVWVVILRALFF